MSHVTPIPGFYEPFSSLSHLLGAFVFAVSSVWLLKRGRGDAARMAGLATFSLGAVFLLSMSGVYHLLTPEGSSREFVRRLDHAAIFILIACTFTPTLIILFRGWRRVSMLLLVWLVAAVGITLKMIYFYQMSPVMGIALYLGMGWLGVYPCYLLGKRYGLKFIQPILWGGAAYTFGAIIESLHWPVLLTGVVQWHEILHAAVLIGLTCHWAFTYQIADGDLAPI